MQVSFNQTEDFVAVHAAEAWCVKHGFSFGFMQGSSPRGLKHGNYSIMKWRNLTTDDIAGLDGRMEGNMRNGPVTIEIKDEVWDAIEKPAEA